MLPVLPRRVEAGYPATTPVFANDQATYHNPNEQGEATGRRIVRDMRPGGRWYYSPDHYQTFREIGDP